MLKRLDSAVLAALAGTPAQTDGIPASNTGAVRGLLRGLAAKKSRPAASPPPPRPTGGVSG